MRLIVGLGNPGNEYENTRHNVGFMMIDEIAKVNNISKYKEFKNGMYFEIIKNGEKIIFLKPQSYMNLSGEVIRKYIDYFKISIEDILVIYDDMDIKIGNIKLKLEGSAAGHNGIKIGISKNNNIDQKDYVLGKFSKEDMNLLNEIKKNINNVIEDYLYLDFEKLMSKYNQKNK